MCKNNENQKQNVQKSLKNSRTEEKREKEAKRGPKQRISSAHSAKNGHYFQRLAREHSLTMTVLRACLAQCCAFKWKMNS